MLERIPEKEVMDDPSQSLSYDEGIKSTSVLGSYLFLADILNLCAPVAGKAIDLGCGSAFLDIELALRVPGLSIDCLDLSEPMLEIAKKNARVMDKQNDSLFQRLRFLKHDVFHLEDLSETYAMATCMFMLHHIKDKKEVIKFLRELKHILTGESAVVFADLLLPRNTIEKNISSFIFTRGFHSVFKRDFSNSLSAAFALEDHKEIFSEAGFKDMEFYTSPFLRAFVFALRPYRGRRAKFVAAQNSPFWKETGNVSKLRYKLSWAMARLTGFKIQENYTTPPTRP